jgi:transglutaminase-like putative cysteine protease
VSAHYTFGRETEFSSAKETSLADLRFQIKKELRMQEYLSPTYFIESGHPEIVAFASAHCNRKDNDINKAVALNLAVRDGIRYNPYGVETAKESVKASTVLKKKEGYCVAKAVLLAACARSQGIPARLGFADVKNHLNTKRLAELMGSDIFVWHGYTELYLNGKWVKATPAFNLELCQNFKVKPLDFDGVNDSIFHPFDQNGNRHMEYIKDHGTFADLPWDRISNAMTSAYPKYFENRDRQRHNFSKEALSETS